MGHPARRRSPLRIGEDPAPPPPTPLHERDIRGLRRRHDHGGITATLAPGAVRHSRRPGGHVAKYARNTREHTPTRHSRRQTKGVAKTALNTRVLRAVTQQTPLRNDVAKTARNTRGIRAGVTPLRRSGECREIRAEYARLLHLCVVRILVRVSPPAAASPSPTETPRMTYLEVRPHKQRLSRGIAA